MEPEAYPTKPRALFGLQIGLRHLLFAMLLAGVLFAHWTNQDAITRLESRLANLQTLSPELIVADPNRIAVIQLPAPWFSSSRWEVFVPTAKVRICLATEDIAPGGIPDKYESVLLPKGQYEVQLEEQKQTSGYLFLVTQNGQACLNVETQRDPASSASGSTTDSDVGSQTKQSDGDVPIVLVRRRYLVPVPGMPGSSTSPKGPAKGLLLWIEKDR